MAVRAKSARAGVYDYLGIEVDPAGTKFQATDKVKVYRPADEVFSEQSVRSFLMRPITNDHPSQAVNADNWSKVAKGIVAKAMRDGDHLAFDLVFMDAATVKDIESGKRELSNGYGTELSFEDGTAPDGTKYQAVQRNIVGNHVALVDKGRAGPDCAISVCDAINPDQVNQLFSDGASKPMKTVLVDGHSVELGDAAAIAVAGLQSKLNDAATTVAKLTTDLATANSEVAKLTTQETTDAAKMATLEQQVKDAAITPEKLRAAGKSYADAVATAKAMVPNIQIGDSMDETAIMKAVVTAKIGDKASAWNADQIAISFDTLKANMGDTLADAIKNISHDAAPTGNLTSFADAAAAAEKARKDRFARFENAHLGTTDGKAS